MDKRKHAQAAGICAIVLSSIFVVLGLALLIVGATSSGITSSLSGVYIGIGVVFMLMAIPQIVIGAVVVKQSFTRVPANGLMIALLVLTILGGSWITLIFVILYFSSQFEVNHVGQNIQPQSRVTTSENKIELLKKLKSEGQLTEQEFKELLLKELGK